MSLSGGVPAHVGDETCAQPADAKFWTVHVHGLDDVIPFDTEDEAASYEAAIVDLTKPGGPLHPSSPFDPVITAHVIPPVRPVEPVADTEAVETVRAKYDRLRERGEPHDTAFYLATARRERAVVTAQHGWFTVDCGAWLGDPPPRSDLSVSQLADLLRLALDGGPIPERYSYWDAFDVLADLHLVATNTIRSLHERRDLIESETTAARLVRARVQRLVLDAGKRKTLRTDDVRAALEVSS